MSAHGLIPENEPARLEALRTYEILETPPEPGFDDLTQLVAQICGTPMASVTLVDANRQWFKARLGLGAEETPRDGFCSHCILQPDLLIVRDAPADERFASHPYVIGDPHIRFYAGMPLVTSDGFALGTLCVIDQAPRELRQDQLEALRALGRQVMAQLELRRLIVRERHRLAELRAVQDAGVSLLASLEPEEVLARIASGICTVAHCRRSAILSYEAETASLRHVAGHGVDEPVPDGARMPLDELPLAERAILSGRPVHSADVEDRSGLIRGAFGFRSALCVPLRSDREILGVVLLEEQDEIVGLPPEQEEVAAAFATLAAIALHHASLFSARNGGAGPPADVVTLTEHELSILRLAAQGLTNPEIGARLYLSRHTVKEYLGNAMHKLGARSRVEAVLRASRLGLIDVADEGP